MNKLWKKVNTCINKISGHTVNAADGVYVITGKLEGYDKNEFFKTNYMDIEEFKTLSNLSYAVNLNWRDLKKIVTKKNKGKKIICWNIV